MFLFYFIQFFTYKCCFKAINPSHLQTGQIFSNSWLHIQLKRKTKQDFGLRLFPPVIQRFRSFVFINILDKVIFRYEANN